MSETGGKGMVSKIRIILLLALFACTWYVIDSTSEVRGVPIKQSLGSFPHTIGEYSLSNTFQSSSDVLEMLGVDDYIQYNYISDKGPRINLYVGYYEAVGIDGGYHSPRNCIPGGGWGIDGVTKRTLDVGTGTGDDVTISEMLIRRGDQYQIVYYWYQNRGRVIASEYWEKIYQVTDALLMGRRDGTFVRVMIPVEGDKIQQSREIITTFSQHVLTLLEQYLPGEVI